ncbi:tRNA (cytosine-5-)-methyltransferase ncl1 [Coemansia thaxteri]|uniref:tRNA (Cytosine-5-)-methyltransferase ncl1 n=1 Tax=Coemansia thaxteri TaxID=2663907 RepID=A0A9W8BDX6_9FUNG|nr:tRNA (cytosine-5-)-methyltransferase ncl1 [Coemansia thaxteri]KAJ2003536.1 tRNA (cytosine-5-)-methyltransferase ncl1 [Coemansia thaxteri]KAJ2470619.1 tRNA (cytosine-5-)-methyltransferase ncl1 [Coemansia sp. RSA 2322]KAJ2481336.1 tRNA (cytosine-5-)-methyltransferase ncl1 [Coemansia sp. RSA 2320]
MGRGGKRGGRGGGRGAKNGGHISGERQSYKRFEDLRRDNDNFRKYYLAQNIVSEDEFPELMESMRTVLPTNFRITGSRQQAIDIREQIMDEFIPFIKETSIDGAEIEPPHPLEWYPNNFGWQFSIPRVALKKSKELSKFHSFLVTETEVGNISRQEAVSMVPPLFLGVQSSHYVLDMCAAPGSKTAQLIEALHSDVEAGQSPTGLVIANDADYKRACMLVHQMNRLNSPNIVVTNHSGERFPNIYRMDAQGMRIPRDVVQFDRILCDVPCSGDGTTRKNVRVWEKWRADDAHSLNPIQSKILQRAAYLLKTGGRLVYSTCSLNPIENEAVVAHVLDHFEGALKLVDVSEQLPALKRRPGLKTWKVMTRDGNLHDEFESIPLDEAGRGRRKYMQKFFPLDQARMEELHIERCMRIYSHLQNTGGFFVAVLEKVAPISVDEKRKAAAEAAALAATVEKIKSGNAAAVDISCLESTAAPATKRLAGESEAGDSDADSVSLKRAKIGSAQISIAGDDGSGDEEEDGDEDQAKRPLYRPDEPREDPALPENPFVFLDASKDDLRAILEYYGIRDTMSRNGFLSRIENGAFRSVYHVSDSVRQLMELAGQRLRVVNTGIRVFSRNSVKGAGCSFRLVCEGVPQLLPHLPDRYVVEASFGDLKTILNEINPLLTALSDECHERLRQVPPSTSVVMVYDPAKHALDTEKPYTRMTAKLSIPCWRGHASLSVHMDKNQLCSLIHRVLGRTVDRNAVGGYRLENNRTAASAEARAALGDGSDAIQADSA